MENECIIHEYWKTVTLKETSCEEYITSIKPLLKLIKISLKNRDEMSEVDFYIYLKNNPLFLQKDNEKESRKFLISISNLRSIYDTYEILFGFLFICKYDFEGFMRSFEQLASLFKAKCLRFSDGDYVVKSSEIYEMIKKIFQIFFANCYEYEARKMKKDDPKIEEIEKKFNRYENKSFFEPLKSYLVQEGKEEGLIEYEYFCQNIVPKIISHYFN